MAVDPISALSIIVRDRLINDADFTALVPPDRVRTDFLSPGQDVGVLLGNGEIQYPVLHESYFYRGFLDVEVFVREPNNSKARQIIHAARKALGNPPWFGEGYVVHGLTLTTSVDRDLGEPELSRGVMSLDVTMTES